MSKDADAFDNRFKILLTGDRFIPSVCLRVAARILLPCSLPRALLLAIASQAQLKAKRMRIRAGGKCFMSRARTECRT